MATLSKWALLGLSLTIVWFYYGRTKRDVVVSYRATVYSPLSREIFNKVI